MISQDHTSHRKPRSRAAYNSDTADKFWSQRVRSTDPLSAVLSYGAPKELNELYDRWERVALERLIPESIRTKRALDIGAGVGRISLMLAAQGADVTAVDVSTEMVKRLNSRAKSAGFTKRITAVHCPSHRIPIADGQFDLITCFGLLEHLPEDVREQTIAEASRLLKRSGRLLVVVNNLDNPFLSRNYPLKRQRPNGYFVTLVGLEWLQEACRQNGLTIRVRAANPWYGLVHYHLYPHVADLELTRRDFAGICSLAVELDASGLLPVAVQRLFASHFLVEAHRIRK